MLWALGVLNGLVLSRCAAACVHVCLRGEGGEVSAEWVSALALSTRSHPPRPPAPPLRPRSCPHPRSSPNHRPRRTPPPPLRLHLRHRPRRRARRSESA